MESAPKLLLNFILEKKKLTQNFIQAKATLLQNYIQEKKTSSKPQLTTASPLTKTLTTLLVIIAIYCGTDPFNHRPMAQFPNFETYALDSPAWKDLPKASDPENLLQKSEIKYLNQVQGPESVVFDPQGHGPYTGIADGRIVFFNGSSWTDFAYTSPFRSEICDPKPSAMSYIKNEHICGRPLGLRFAKNGDLYIADAYFGVLKVGPEGGLATQLVKEVDGSPLKFTNDLDVDEDGYIYFTESSTNFERRNYVQLVLSAEPSGRLLKFDPYTNRTTVLVPNLQNPNGVTLSKDQSFVLYAEGLLGRLSRYWLKGPKAGSWEDFVIMPGHPDNVRTNSKGEFWVAIHCRRSLFFHLANRYPRLRKFFLKLPIKVGYIYMKYIGGRHHGMVLKYSESGELLQVLEDREGRVVRVVSEVEEHDGKLWIGSVLMPFVAVYSLQDAP